MDSVMREDSSESLDGGSRGRQGKRPYTAEAVRRSRLYGCSQRAPFLRRSRLASAGGRRRPWRAGRSKHGGKSRETASSSRERAKVGGGMRLRLKTSASATTIKRVHHRKPWRSSDSRPRKQSLQLLHSSGTSAAWPTVAGELGEEDARLLARSIGSRPFTAPTGSSVLGRSELVVKYNVVAAMKERVDERAAASGSAAAAGGDTDGAAAGAARDKWHRSHAKKGTASSARKDKPTGSKKGIAGRTRPPPLRAEMSSTAPASMRRGGGGGSVRGGTLSPLPSAATAGRSWLAADARAAESLSGSPATRKVRRAVLQGRLNVLRAEEEKRAVELEGTAAVLERKRLAATMGGRLEGSGDELLAASTADRGFSVWGYAVPSAHDMRPSTAAVLRSTHAHESRVNPDAQKVTCLDCLVRKDQSEERRRRQRRLSGRKVTKAYTTKYLRGGLFLTKTEETLEQTERKMAESMLKRRDMRPDALQYVHNYRLNTGKMKLDALKERLEKAARSAARAALTPRGSNTSKRRPKKVAREVSREQMIESMKQFGLVSKRDLRQLNRLFSSFDLTFRNAISIDALMVELERMDRLYPRKDGRRRRRNGR